MKEIVKKYWYIFLMVFLMVFVIILCFVFCMWSKEEKITIEKLTWKTIVDVEELTPNNYYGRTYVPTNAYNVHMYRRLSYKSFKPYYDYTLDEWEVVNTFEKTGERGNEIEYANPELEKRQRTKKRIKYKVEYKNEEGECVSEEVSKSVWNELPNSGEQAIVILKVWGISQVER